MGTITTEDAITYDPKTETYQLSPEWWHDKTLSTAVSIGVAAVTNTPPTELDPLYETVDSDALNHLFDPMVPQPSRQNYGQLTFSYNDCTVAVYSDGTIKITPLDANGTTAPDN